MASKATVSPISNEPLAKIADNVIVNVKTKEEIQFKSLWKNNTVVIIFMRRFGCVFCRFKCQNLSNIQPQLVKRDIALVGIGFEWEGVEEFLEKGYFNGELYIDSESRKCYKDLGFERSTLSKFASIKKFFSSKYMTAMESVTGNSRGDDDQYGGMIIIGKGGREIFLLRREQSAMDMVDNQTILRMLGIIEIDLVIYAGLQDFGIMDYDLSIQDKIIAQNIQATQQAADNVIANPMVEDEDTD